MLKTLNYMEGDFPAAEKLTNHCLSLPMSPYLSEKDQTKILGTIINKLSIKELR